jgi:hypothetical protein
MTYVIWNVDFQGYRPRNWDAKHGGIFAAERFATRDEARMACHRKGDIVHVLSDKTGQITEVIGNPVRGDQIREFLGR